MNEYIIYYRTKDGELYYGWWNGSDLKSAIDSANYDLQNIGEVDAGRTIAENEVHTEIREIIEGGFVEGEKVTVNIDGKIITRKVYWSGYSKDLYIVYKNARYFYSEFWNR